MKQKEQVKKLSVAERVRERLENDFYVQKALALDIANYSAVAEGLSRELGTNFEATKVAVFRFASELKGKGVKERNVEPVLSGTRMTLSTNVSSLVFENHSVVRENLNDLFKARSVFSVVTAPNSVTVIVKDADADSAVKHVGKNFLLERSSDLYLLLLESPKEITSTPGVMVYFLDRLARENINVAEFYSCYTSTALLFKKLDGLRAFRCVCECTGGVQTKE